MPGRHVPPDHSAGDESTLGGYRAVHGRPAAFEGMDGVAYSVEVMVDRTDDAARPFAAYLMFLRWRRVGTPGVDSHVESPYIAFGTMEPEARSAVERMPLREVKETLDTLLRERGAQQRRWWDAMRDETE